MVAKITRAYVRTYRDTLQTTAYVEWSDGARTEGTARSRDIARKRIKAGQGQFYVGAHMAALLDRAKREGLTIEREVW